MDISVGKGLFIFKFVDVSILDVNKEAIISQLRHYENTI